jgi:hypothetical protein
MNTEEEKRKDNAEERRSLRGAERGEEKTD